MITKVPARVAATLAGLGVVGLLGACSAGSPPQKVVTVTVPPTSATSGSVSSGSATNSSGAPASGSGSASTSAVQRTLPGDCDSLLPDYTVAQAIGRSTFTGDDGFVVGVAEPDISRLANINCRYGVTGSGAKATAAVEIGVSLYATTTAAAARVSATVSDYTAHGAQSADVTVGGQQGQLLTGGVGSGYTDPLLVVAAGQRTVAVTVAPAIASGTAVSATSVELAALAVTKTAA